MKKNEKDIDKNKKEEKKVKKDKIKKDKTKKKKKRAIDVDKEAMYSFKEVNIIMFFSLAFGFLACFSFTRIFMGGKNYRILAKDLSKLVDTYYAIKENYYGELDTDALVDSAIQGMISSIGDVYTTYSDTESTSDFMQTVSGVYEGIGCTIAMDLDGRIIIVDMFENSPSERAGLQVGDIIIKIDGEDYTDKSSTDMANYIKENNNSEVNLTILREDEEIDVTVVREKIEIPYVSGEVIEKDEKKVGYINISLFSSTVGSQFKNKLEELEDEGIDSLVIDVRDNNGGYLSGVTSIINMLTKKGDIIYQLENSDGVVSKKDDTKEKRTYPIAILVNSASASASEILAAAIKESYGGFVVGTNTYGKGTVQQTTTLPDGSMIKYTVQKWLTPNGNWVNEVGLEPTDYVELDTEYYQNPSHETDNQLQSALDLVTK